MRGACRATLVAMALAAFPVTTLGPAVAGASDPAASWRAEFDEICSKTQDAMVLKDDELRSLVQRCDALAPIVEKLEESQRKVYTRRLKGCRDLYQFVLDCRQPR